MGSPLPKLSMLVLAEAKYQGQLQALRAQQELLRQQQEEMLKRKSAQAKQVAAERVLARERRRLFLLATERRQREEELKYGRESSTSGSPEQDEDETSRATTTPSVEPSKPNRKKRMKEIQPTPFVRTLAHSVRAAAAGSEPSNLNSIDSGSSAPSSLGGAPVLPGLDATHERERRKNIRRMVGCYAQDLTPMVNGHKPKLLPVPTSVPSGSSLSCASVAKKTAAKHQQQSSTQRCGRPSHVAVKTSTQRTHHVRLRPLNARTRMPPQRSNQFDERELLSCSSSPLTAEIKPMAWVYALGRDVLDDDSAAPPPPLPTRFTQLGCVQEEEEGGDGEPVVPPPLKSTLSFDLRLQHKLPPKTELLTPLTPVAVTSASSGNSAFHATMQYEYSTVRLTSLLEKYNVSVSSPSASTLRT